MLRRTFIKAAGTAALTQPWLQSFAEQPQPLASMDQESRTKDMSNYTHNTAPTQFVKTSGTLQSGHLSMLSHTAEVTTFVEKAASSLKP